VKYFTVFSGGVIVVTDFFDYSFNWLVPIFRWLLVALNLADDEPPARPHVNEASSVNDSLVRLHGTPRGVSEAHEVGGRSLRRRDRLRKVLPPAEDQEAADPMGQGPIRQAGVRGSEVILSTDAWATGKTLPGGRNGLHRNPCPEVCCQDLCKRGGARPVQDLDGWDPPVQIPLRITGETLISAMTTAATDGFPSRMTGTSFI
jgi:hypothetical protein